MTMKYQIEPCLPGEDMAWFLARQFEASLENNALPAAKTQGEQAAAHREELLNFLASQAHAKILICRREDGLRLGYIWIAERGYCDPWDFGTAPAWIYDLRVEPAFRRRGVGRALLLTACRQAREAGFSRIGLHVFGHNLAAIKLYQAVGFSIAHSYLQKQLDSQPVAHPAGDAPYRVQCFTPGDDTGKLTALWYQNFKAISQAFGASSVGRILDQFNELSHKADFNSPKQTTFMAYDPQDRLAGFVRVYRSKGDLGNQSYTWMWAPEISTEYPRKKALEVLLQQVDAWSWDQDLNVIRTGPYPDQDLRAEVQAQGYGVANLFMFKSLEVTMQA
jgi:ribosomal protein S18 acetylase RimI-like enzyme